MFPHEAAVVLGVSPVSYSPFDGLSTETITAGMALGANQRHAGGLLLTVNVIHWYAC